MQMDDHRILVLSAMPPELRAKLEQDFTLDEYEPGTDAPGYAIAVTTSVGGLDQDLSARLPDLRLLLCNGTGLDRIDLPAAHARGVIVRNTPDEVVDDTAEFAVAMLFATSRRLVEADRFVRAGQWGPSRMAPSRRTSAMTVGIVGLGRIGQTIAGHCAAIGVSVVYAGPTPKPDQPYRHFADLREMAAHVDALVLSCAGGPETHHLVGKDILEALGPQGILINVSRGSVVDEAALLAALEGGAIAGAGLDVFASEPALDPRFLALENVVLSPHYASVTDATRQGMADTLAEAAHDFLAGRGDAIQDAAAGH